jgi:predicted nucleic acid-binding protein
MKKIVFDAGPVISLAMTNLLWVLEKLKKKDIMFYISSDVKKELFDNPLHTKKFKFEALQIKRLIEKKVLTVYDSITLQQHTKELLEHANATLSVTNHDMQTVHTGEMSSLAAYLELQADAIVIDERITRLLVEDIDRLAQLMSRRLHRKVKVKGNEAKFFRKKVKGVKLIRSVELAAVAFEKGLLNEFVVTVPRARKELLEGVLWSLKLHGCAVTAKEINTMTKSL